MIELALDFTNYHFILLLLIIIGITAYFYLELKIIKKNLLIINDNFQAPSIDSIIHDNDIDSIRLKVTLRTHAIRTSLLML